MSTLKTWTASSLARIYPLSTPPGEGYRGVPRLDLAANETGSFQVGLRHDDEQPLIVTLRARPHDAFKIRIRLAGLVPLPHHNTLIPFDAAELDGIGMTPGFVPDPLFDETTLLLPPRETRSFWITLVPKRGAPVGRHQVRIDVTPKKGTGHSLGLPVNIYPLKIAPRRNFPVAHWFYVDALMDHYGCPNFNPRFWSVLEAYLRDLTEHGQDTVLVPVFTPPTDGVKRPSQLLRVSRRGKRFVFDWRDVKQYVDLARRCGVRNFEWTHFFTQWGAKNAIRVYEGQGTDEIPLWPEGTGATSPAYRAFLADYLPRFQQFLKTENLMDVSFFHVSDEPQPEHRAAYQGARAMLTEMAPWMKVMDAVSEIEYGRDKLTDMPVVPIEQALDFQREHIDCWCYYACGPRGKYLTRLMDTPLPKIRMNGWLFYRWPFRGFLHWGYNYWHRSQTREIIDPYMVSDAHSWPSWCHGDPFLVYPGKDGPVDSIRWEVFAESLRDYALLQTLDIPRDGSFLRSLRSFEDFPKSADWIRGARHRLLQRSLKA